MRLPIPLEQYRKTEYCAEKTDRKNRLGKNLQKQLYEEREKPGQGSYRIEDRIEFLSQSI